MRALLTSCDKLGTDISVLLWRCDTWSPAIDTVLLHCSAHVFVLVSFPFDQELIPYRYSSCCFCWGNALQKSQDSVFSNPIEVKFDKIVLRVNVHRLTESIFWYDVKRSTFWPWRHSHPPTARCCICNSFRRLLASSPSACDVISWSIVHSYLIIF